METINRDFKMLVDRLRTNMERNMMDYDSLNKKIDERIKKINELREIQSAGLRAGRGRR